MQGIKTLSGWRHVHEKGRYDTVPQDPKGYDHRKTNAMVSMDNESASVLHGRRVKFNKAASIFFPAAERNETDVLLEDGSYLCQVTVERDPHQFLHCFTYNYMMYDANITALTKLDNDYQTVKSKGTVHVTYEVSDKDPVNFGFLYRQDPTFMKLTFSAHGNPVDGFSQEFRLNKQSVLAYEDEDQPCQDIVGLTATSEDAVNMSTRYEFDYYTRE